MGTAQAAPGDRGSDDPIGDLRHPVIHRDWEHGAPSSGSSVSAALATRRSRADGFAGKIPGAHLAIALVTAVLVAGCGLGPSGLGGFRTSTTTHPAASPTPPAGTALAVEAGTVYGNLDVPPATISCSDSDSSVVVAGPVQSVMVTVKFIHLRPSQNLSIPPPLGSFSDRVTITTAGPGGPQSLEYVAGYQGGTYQGTGTLVVNKHGSGGTVSLNTAAPAGQNPSVQVSGNTTFFDNNSGGLSGTWQCP